MDKKIQLHHGSIRVSCSVYIVSVGLDESKTAHCAAQQTTRVGHGVITDLHIP